MQCSDSGRGLAIPDNVIRLLTVLTFLLTLLFQGCAASREAHAARMDRRIELAVAVLEQGTDADSLAVAGLLRSSEREPGPAVDALARATAVAPERADLAWLKIPTCREVPAVTPNRTRCAFAPWIRPTAPHG
jgi:hypothetical protein